MSKCSKYLLAALVFSCLYALRSDVEAYIGTMWMGDLLAYIYKACTTNELFNILLLLTIVCSICIIGKKVYNSKGSILRAIGYGFAVAYLFSNNHWLFAKSFFIGMDYDLLLIVLLMTLLIIEIVAIVRTAYGETKQSFSDDKTGYCMDKVYSGHKETGWRSYVDDLLALMPRERLKNESLAIGISGRWGSGKTSFLETMKKRMNANYRVVSFNPWMCTGKEQVSVQFFALLQQLTKDDKDLLDAIRRYRDIMLDADVHPLITAIAKILPFRKDIETMETLKDKIGNAILANDGKPFAFFIDDLDRLEGDEVFEVLRLIRVTANFYNVVFIVAYDRNYICDVLNESKNIKRAEEYLQKIFHLEISLPKFEDASLLDVFIEEIARIMSLDREKEKWLRRYVNQLLNTDELSFTDFVPNFRQARRFANVLALNLKSVTEHTKDIVVRDFLGIELVHFAFPDIYQTLMYKPMKLLKKQTSKKSKACLLIYENNDNSLCANLLKKLFSDKAVTAETPREIRSLLSYDNYFCYRLPSNAVGATAFEMTMIADDVDDVRRAVREWMQKKDVFRSLYEHFLGYYMHDYNDAKVIRNFICALLEFLPMLSDCGIRQIAANRCWVRHDIVVGELQKLIIPLFEYSINQGQHLEKINKFMTTFIPDYVDSSYEPLDLLEYSQLTKFADKLLAKYIAQNGKPPISDISKKNSPFNTFLLAASYQRYASNGEEDVRIKSNFLHNALIKQYKGSEANIATFHQFIEPYMIKTDNPDEEEYEAQKIQNDIYSIFGDYENFREFVHEAFCQNDEIDKLLKRICKISHWQN